MYKKEKEVAVEAEATNSNSTLMANYWVVMANHLD